MIRQTRQIQVAVLLTLSLVLCTGSGKRDDCKDTLGRFVPDDVWVFESTWHDPQRDFVAEHYARVWNSVKKSGVFDEFKSMLESDMSADHKTAFDDFWSQATALCGAVNWYDLIRNESAFACRFDNVLPEFFVLFDAQPDTRDDNVTALSNIFTALADVSDVVTLSTDDYAGAKVWTLSISQAPISLHLAQKDNVIGVFMGQAAMRDCLDLISGKSSKKPIVESSRFQEALARVDAPTFSVSFLDMEGLFRFLRKVPEMAKAKHSAHHTGTGPEPEQIAGMIGAIFDQFDMFDWVIMTGSMDGTKEYYHEFTRTKPNCTDKACHRMCAGQKMFTNYDRFLPRSAKTFAV